MNAYLVDKHDLAKHGDQPTRRTSLLQNAHIMVDPEEIVDAALHCLCYSLTLNSPKMDWKTKFNFRRTRQ